ncbi:MAG: thioester reductase domain-containing protein [Spirosomataceae bacterium]
MKSFFETIDEWVQHQPEKTLYTFLDINGLVKESFTYAEFEKRVAVIADNLHHRYKFRRNDKILLAFPPGIETICAFFACARIGLIPVPTYPPSTSGFQASYSKMVFIATDCEAKGVLTSDEYYWNLKLNVSKNNIDNKTILNRIPWINTNEFTEFTSNKTLILPEADFLFLQYTSGSTSDPKGVIVTHKNILHNATLAVDHLPIGVTWLPQYHDMGLIGYYLFFALKGGTTYGFSSLDFIKKPSLWLETITKYGGTASSAPNFAYEYCMKPGKISPEVLEKIDLSTIRYLMNAAEPVRATTYLNFIEFFKPYGLNPQSHFVAYGLAENTLAVSNYGKNVLTVATEALHRNKLFILSSDSKLPKTQIMSCGIPLGDQVIKIVDPENLTDLYTETIGEIWVNGDSKCLGYWKKDELNKQIFYAELQDSSSDNSQMFLRTGDLGFLYNNELYVCGRMKDTIIVRGLNYYPHDIESIVENSHKDIREGFVAAFSVQEDGEEKLVVIAGVKNINKIPDPTPIREAVTKQFNILLHSLAFVHTKSIPKTSSGKIMRSKAKELWISKKLEIVSEYVLTNDKEQVSSLSSSPFEEIKRKYNLIGSETYSLAEVLDSLDLVCLVKDVEDLLLRKGNPYLSKQVDNRLLQEINVSEFFSLVEEIESASLIGLQRLKKAIDKLRKEHRFFEQKIMLADCNLSLDINNTELAHNQSHKESDKILLTGGTGFLGPFLIKSLLENTKDIIYVLIRSQNQEHGKSRIIEEFKISGIYTSWIEKMFEERVVAVPGDLSKEKLGLNKEDWDELSESVHTIYNNGAMVNYLYNYARMKETNVKGTNEIIRFALNKQPKILNHISTTFVFGWAVKDTLFETDFCEDLNLLDFGYSQTKWVSEQLVVKAMEQGLHARIFRPALITPSANGEGNNFDIAIRLIAFMINHGISVNTQNQVSFVPVDVVAANIVATSNLPDTLQKIFHVTRDEYSNMMDIMQIVQKYTGIDFQEFKLKQFVPEVVSRCQKEDLLFPLLDFLVRSTDNISKMEFKLYNNDNYKNAKSHSKASLADPSLENTIKGMLLFMKKKGIIYADFKI